MDYYGSEHVRARILEYCGGTPAKPPTAAYVAAIGPKGSPMPSWDHADRVPVSQIHTLWDQGSDLARSLWDSDHLLFVLDLDYQNVDAPAEPFLHPADAFVKLEPTYQATAAVLRSFQLTTRAMMTGRGYHFAGQLPLDHPIIELLAAIVPETPAWYAEHETRRPAGVTLTMTEREARAATGLGCLMEYAAHLILDRVAHSAVPVVFNGTVVGKSGPVGRECVSIDFSQAGDPLDIRHVRVAFSTYQWHRQRPDIFGAHTAATVAPMAAVPRGRQPLMTLLASGRSLSAAARTAQGTGMQLPDITRGMAKLLAAYESSTLAAFHRAFYAELRATDSRSPRLDLRTLPPCAAAALIRPNDLLLKPEFIQHLVRELISREWRPARIARLMQAAYEADHHWGDRWVARMHPSTRAEFEVRVFAGLMATGRDMLVDFNCVSAQEKGLCPSADCHFDLRIDRAHLVSQPA